MDRTELYYFKTINKDKPLHSKKKNVIIANLDFFHLFFAARKIYTKKVGRK